jgi:hypothetical protein
LDIITDQILRAGALLHDAAKLQTITVVVIDNASGSGFHHLPQMPSRE